MRRLIGGLIVMTLASIACLIALVPQPEKPAERESITIPESLRTTGRVELAVTSLPSTARHEHIVTTQEIAPLPDSKPKAPVLRGPDKNEQHTVHVLRVFGEKHGVNIGNLLMPSESWEQLAKEYRVFWERHNALNAERLSIDDSVIEGKRAKGQYESFGKIPSKGAPPTETDRAWSNARLPTLPNQSPVVRFEKGERMIIRVNENDDLRLPAIWKSINDNEAQFFAKALVIIGPYNHPR